MRHILPTVLIAVLSMFKKIASFNLGTTCENYRNTSCWTELKSDTHESDTKWQTWNKLQYLKKKVIHTILTNLTHFFVDCLQVHIIVYYVCINLLR